jgi:TPR repeat protein
VALPSPTPVTPPFLQARAPRRNAQARPLLVAGLACAVLAGAGALYSQAREAIGSVGARKAVVQASRPDPRERIAKLLRSDEEREFQSAFGELARLASQDRHAADAIAAAIASEYGDALSAPSSRAVRTRAMSRLVWMARAGDGAAARRIEAFEKDYDHLKQTVAKSSWWSLGRGIRPDDAARWMEDGELLAQHGDRPAMLDVAFALGHGRGARRDRLAAAETYLKVIDRSPEDDEASARIRRAATRGLAALLNSIVEQKDEVAARSVLPVVAARAEAGPADLQFYAGLLSECALEPADLEAARAWYRKAAVAAGWKDLAERKARTLGTGCPGAAAVRS